MKIVFILSASFLIGFWSICCADEITDEDTEIILNSDCRTAAFIFNKYYPHGREGRMTIESVVPIVGKRVLKMLDQEKSGLGECEGEFLGVLIQLLSDSGDIRAKEALLKAMTSGYVGGKILDEGILHLCPQVIPDIVAYLDGNDIVAKRQAIRTLSYINANDGGKTYFSDKDKKEIKEKLLPCLSHTDEILKLWTVEALGHFGDDLVIPLLENIRDNNMQTNNDDRDKERKQLREAAEKSILLIREK